MDTPQLYPLSIGEILDQAFSLYRRKFGLLIGITLVAYVPMTILQMISFSIFKSTGVADWIQSVFISLLVSGALLIGLSQIYLGHSVTVREAYRGIWQRYWSAWGGQFWVGLSIGSPLFAVVCVLSILMNGMETPTIYLMLLVLLPFGIYLGTRWSLILPAILLESCKAKEGLDRSWKLTEGIFWRVFGTTFLVSLLIFVFSSLPQYAVLYGLEFFIPGSGYGVIVQKIISQLAIILGYPLSQGVNIVLFYDILVRKEGFDLALQLGPEPIKELSEESAEQEEPYTYSENPWEFPTQTLLDE